MKRIFPALAAVLIALSGCAAEPSPGAPAPISPPASSAETALFPKPDRPVASIITNHSGNEAERDRDGEAAKVMAILQVRPGLVIADIGAGEGYFTTRLARATAPDGKVIATDVVPAWVGDLRQRVAREGLSNVDVRLGGVDDPKLPAPVDIALMVRMYHEIEDPYAFIWRLRDQLKPGGVVAVSERDRPTAQHGAPPALLRCEFEAVGYTQVGFHPLGGSMGYLAIFAPTHPRPAPDAIRPCKA
jgi:predicted methyltransferase